MIPTEKRKRNRNEELCKLRIEEEKTVLVRYEVSSNDCLLIYHHGEHWWP